MRLARQVDALAFASQGLGQHSPATGELRLEFDQQHATGTWLQPAQVGGTGCTKFDLSSVLETNSAACSPSRPLADSFLTYSGGSDYEAAHWEAFGLHAGGAPRRHRHHRRTGSLALAGRSSCPRGSAAVELLEQPQAAGARAAQLQ